jgi:DnaJ-class molecular chaperone
MSTVKTGPRTFICQEYVTCAFCQGHGTDPFSVMSSLSVCGACQGTGHLLVTVPHVSCAYCGGSGSYKTYRCSVCSGAGVVPKLEGPTVVCTECGGRAADGSSGLVCLHCRGRGEVPAGTERIG